MEQDIDINQIEAILHNNLQLEQDMVDERYDDVFGSKPSLSRKTKHYYENTRKYQESLDKSFREIFPNKFKEITESIGSAEDNWQKAIQLSSYVTDNLKEGNLGFGGLIDCRAKGVLSHFDKMQRYDIPVNAVLDTIGVRLTVKTVDQARQVKEYLLTKYEVVDTKSLNNKLGEPISDTFDEKGGMGYSHIRLNLRSPEGYRTDKFEIQIEALERFKRYGYREMMTIDFGAASPKWGSFRIE